MGDVVRKTDRKALLDMLHRQEDEIIELIRSDERVAYETFLYEMNNHEYCINWSADEDTLGSLGMTYENLTEWDLVRLYLKARREHMRIAHEEWEII